MLNSPLIQELIAKGDVAGIKPIMGKSGTLGMQTFDQALFKLHQKDRITFDEAIAHADSPNDLRLRIKLEGKDAVGGLGNTDIGLVGNEEEE